MTAAGSVATIAIGGILGYVGYRISTGQREVAGLTVLREVTVQFFDSKPLLNARRGVTRQWLERHGRKQEGVTDRQDPSLRQILNCFQDAAVYVQRGHVPADVVWDCLSYWVLVYWYVAQRYVLDTREKTRDRTAWAPVGELVEKLHRVAEAKGIEDWSHEPTSSDLLEFFAREAKSLGRGTPRKPAKRAARA